MPTPITQLPTNALLRTVLGLLPARYTDVPETPSGHIPGYASIMHFALRFHAQGVLIPSERYRRTLEMDFQNATTLDDDRLHQLFLRHTRPYRHDNLRVRVRYSRGADFSGTCFYKDGRIFINLGRHLRFPYALGTHLAKASSNRTHWWRETYEIRVSDAYQLALFIYRHELYHYLVKVAGRNPRRKESMCDRFAARALVDGFGCPVRDPRGQPVARNAWDFKDLDAFVAAAPRETDVAAADQSAARRPKPAAAHERDPAPGPVSTDTTTQPRPIPVRILDSDG